MCRPAFHSSVEEPYQKSKETEVTLEETIKEGYISVRKHPSADLYIYNYTPRAQFDNVWNEHTLECRGLIKDSKGKIVSRPFKKFFNIEQVDPKDIPNESFEVFEKLDGSMAVTYWIEDEIFLSTRGSFESEQAIDATRILREKYSHIKFDKDKTYVFEYIAPQNRIVVDYGDTRDIFLLAIIDTQTGNFLPLENIGTPVATKHPFSSFNTIKELNWENKEGFAVRFKSGFQVKIKFEDYVRLHKILTNVSTKTVWEYLRTDTPFDELLEKVPDEFNIWLKKVRSELLAKYQEIADKAKSDMIDFTGKSRKESAGYIKKCQYPNVMFQMLDKKSFDDIIWKMIKPKFEKSFKSMDEEI